MSIRFGIASPTGTARGTTDHGSLSGRGDDDHAQYSLVDGTRAFTGTVGGITPVVDADLVTKAYVDAAIEASGVNYAASGHTHALDDLSDVVITSPAEDDILKYEGGTWINSPSGHTHEGAAADHDHTLDDLLDVSTSGANTPSDGYALTWNEGSGLWIPGEVSTSGHTHVELDITDLQSYALDSHAHSIDDLTDVTVANPVNSEVLTYDSEIDQWVNAPAQGGAWELSDLPSGVIWLDATGIAVGYSQDDEILYWFERINQYDASQTTPNGPRWYDPDVFPEQNGWGMAFTATSDLLAFPTWAEPTGSFFFTFVFNAVSDNALTQYIFSSTPDAVNHDITLMYGGNATGKMGWRDSSQSILNVCDQPPTGLHVTSWLFDDMEGSGYIYVDGVLQGWDVYVPSAISIDPKLGAYWSGTNAFDGRIGEFMVANSFPTTEERQKTEGYLAHKWNIEDQLGVVGGSTHPYRFDPPGAAMALNDLTDVEIDSPTVDQMLQYDGVDWVNTDIPATGHTHIEYANKVLAETITGVWTHENAFIINPEVFSTSVVGLTMGLTDFVGSASNSVIKYQIGDLVSSDSLIPASRYGWADGLGITLTNTNTTKAGTGKGSITPNALFVTQNHDHAVSDVALTMVNGTLSASTTATTAVVRAQSMAATGNSTGAGLQSGVIGCFFQGNNTTSGAGDAKGILGWGQHVSSTATGKANGVFANVIADAGATSTTLAAFDANFLGFSNSAFQYLLINVSDHGANILSRGGLWLTDRTTDLAASNPSHHLTVSTTQMANFDAFIEGDAEIDGTLWLDGDLVHSSGNIGVFGADPTGQAAALVQTYSTADRTLSAYTADNESASYTGIPDGSGDLPYAHIDDLNALRTAYENLRTFTEDLAQFVNALVDDQQTYGWEQ
jgi:hypothetical protein